MTELQVAMSILANAMNILFDETVMRKHVQNMSKVVCGAIIAFKDLIHLTLYVLLLSILILAGTSSNRTQGNDDSDIHSPCT